LKSLKGLSLTLALLGVLAATVLAGWSGFGRVAASTLSVGYGGFALLCGWQFLVAAVLGIGWRVIAPVPPERRGLALDAVFIWARLVRDASASCLPFAQLGGFAIGARALSLHGQTWLVATTSTIGDATAEFLAEIIFAAAGVVVLAAQRVDWITTAPWTIGVALAVVVGSGLLSLPYRAAPLLARSGRWIVGRGFDLAGKNAQTIEPELARIYGRVEHFAASNAIHFLGWAAKGAGGWIAFRLLGAPISLLDALAIEGLLYAGLAFAFLVPGYAGVQEGAYMLLGAAFGVPPEIALGTSLLRRGRDIAIGIPILLIWQFVELRRLRQRRGERPRLAQDGGHPRE
jgi:glycosyltransferase 2 family protein